MNMLGENKPTSDPYTNEWYREQFNKMQYHWNRSMTEEVALSDRFNVVSTTVREIASQRSRDMAKLGELAAQVKELSKQNIEQQERFDKKIAELQERLDKASQAMAAMQKKLKQEATA